MQLASANSVDSASLILFVRSFIMIRNNSCDIIDPWGIPFSKQMKFMLNVAAITWMMSDSRMGLLLTYNVVGLMSNNLSQYTHEKLYYAHCTGSSMYMYICPNSLYIYRVVVQGVCHVPFICRRWSHVAGVSPFDIAS